METFYFCLVIISTLTKAIKQIVVNETNPSGSNLLLNDLLYRFYICIFYIYVYYLWEYSNDVDKKNVVKVH